MTKTSSIHPFVSVQYRHVTDRQTDGQTHDDSKYHASVAARSKKVGYKLLTTLTVHYIRGAALEMSLVMWTEFPNRQ